MVDFKKLADQRRDGIQKSFVPSKYQQAVFDYFSNRDGNRAVRAVAGSGKTTTLVKGLNMIPETEHRDITFLAFNRSIVADLSQRLPANINVQTIHSLGFATLKRGIPVIKKWNVQARKYHDMARNISVPGNYGDRDEVIDSIVRVLELAQATLTPIEVDSLGELALRFNVNIPLCGIEPIAQGVKMLLEVGIEKAKTEGLISFGDQLWIPAYHGFKADQYGLVCVDEAQDLTAAQMAIVRAVTGGNMISVGDPRQAIYGFAGAETDSFFQLVRYFDAQEMPLSICYRCPSSVVEQAKKIVPEIEAAEGVRPGIVDTISNNDFLNRVRPGDMVLCRTTAPLVKLCFYFIGRRVPATIKGRDISAGLCTIVESVAKRIPNFSQFPNGLTQYEERQLAALKAKPGTEAQQESLSDRIEAVRVCYSSFNAVSARGLIAEIKELFSDGEGRREQIVLSTAHRSKGLENPVVFVVRPEKLPLVWKNQTPEQYAQEMNLKYVTITRAQEELYFVETDIEEGT